MRSNRRETRFDFLQTQLILIFDIYIKHILRVLRRSRFIYLECVVCVRCTIIITIIFLRTAVDLPSLEKVLGHLSLQKLIELCVGHTCCTTSFTSIIAGIICTQVLPSLVARTNERNTCFKKRKF